MLTVLTTAQIDAIHEASLRILHETGIRLDEPSARALLLDHGAREARGRICLPPELVERCLATCPSQAKLRGRGSEITLGDGTLSVHNLGGARDVLDLRSGQLRPATTADVAESTRLLDALENVTTVTPLYTPQDVPSSAMTQAMFDQTVRHTLKPINGPGVQTASEARRLFEMMQVVFGAQPSISVAVSPISPLTFPAELAQALLEIARLGLPCGPLPCPSAGATAPMSLAGALAQQNAEILACVVLLQLARPGLPVIYCGRLAVLDMRIGLPAWGNPETGLTAAASVQLGHRYRLPVNVYGLACSTCALDIQNGYERALNAIVPALAGADELSGVGEMAGGVCSCNAQMVIDDGIMGMVRRLRRGFAVDADSLAVEQISQAMDGERNFLAMRHTVRYLRAGEVWHSRLGVPDSSWQAWQETGALTAVDRAQQRADQLLATHQVPPLPDHEARALDELVQSAGSS
jgi:trimethylamine--corrinoid protein Co-methyltransferase